MPLVPEHNTGLEGNQPEERVLVLYALVLALRSEEHLFLTYTLVFALRSATALGTAIAGLWSPGCFLAAFVVTLPAVAARGGVGGGGRGVEDWGCSALLGLACMVLVEAKGKNSK